MKKQKSAEPEKSKAPKKMNFFVRAPFHFFFWIFRRGVGEKVWGAFTLEQWRNFFCRVLPESSTGEWILGQMLTRVSELNTPEKRREKAKEIAILGKEASPKFQKRAWSMVLENSDLFRERFEVFAIVQDPELKAYALELCKDRANPPEDWGQIWAYLDPGVQMEVVDQSIAAIEENWKEHSFEQIEALFFFFKDCERDQLDRVLTVLVELADSPARCIWIAEMAGPATEIGVKAARKSSNLGQDALERMRALPAPSLRVVGEGEAPEGDVAAG